MRISLVGLMLFALATASYAQQPTRETQKPSTSGTPNPATGTAKSSTAAKSASADNAFVMKAAGANMAEVELGKMATEKAMRDEVKKFGQMMVDDHTKAGDELKTIATQKNITWPTELDREHKALQSKLSGLSGAEFDRAYMQAMVDGHKKVAADVRKESTSGKDSDVKAWAAKTLPTVEMHLKQAESIDRDTHSSSAKGDHSGGAKGDTRSGATGDTHSGTTPKK
jgi:putative membrane protein